MHDLLMQSNINIAESMNEDTQKNMREHILLANQMA